MVGRHLDFMSEFLHHHHSAEDAVLWPVLVERVPDELAPLVELMEAQHERVDELLQEINALVPEWSATASAADRDRLAGAARRAATSGCTSTWRRRRPASCRSPRAA